MECPITLLPRLLPQLPQFRITVGACIEVFASHVPSLTAAGLSQRIVPRKKSGLARARMLISAETFLNRVGCRNLLTALDLAEQHPGG